MGGYANSPDELMLRLCDNEVLKAITAGCKDTQTVSVDGDTITFAWDKPVRHDYTLRFDEEFDGKDIVGNPVKYKTFMRGSTCVVEMTPEDENAKKQSFERDIVDGELVWSFFVEGKYLAKRISKKQ
ncbi:hypothetical protein ScPMuIL_006956 [Solemya velum]